MKSINIDKIQGSDAKPEVVEVYRELKRFKDAPERKDWLTRDKDGEKAVIFNEMWESGEKEELAETGQIPVTVNKCRKGVQGNSAIVTANNPEIKVFPTRESDPYVAELLKWALDFVAAKNNKQEVIRDVVDRKETGGHGFFYVKQDESKGMFGRVVVEGQDPTLWYWDAKSKKRDFSDTHLIKAQLRTKKYILDHYDVKEEDLVFEKVDDTDEERTGELTDTVEGEDNYAIDPEKPGDTPEDLKKRVIWEIEAYMLKVEKEDWAVFMRKGDESPTVVKIGLRPGQKPEDVIKDYAVRNGFDLMADHWPRRVSNRYLRLIVGKKLIPQTDESKQEVDELLNPYGVDSDGDPVLPVIPLTGKRAFSHSYCYASTFYALPVNKSLNKREAQFIFAVSKALNAPVVRTDDSKWSGQPDKPGSELIVDKAAPWPPFRLSPGTVDLSGLAMRIEEDKQNIDDQYDLPEVMRGKIPKGQENMSGKLGLALQDTASMMQNPTLKELEVALVKGAKAELAIILRVWPKYMWDRLLPEGGRETKYPEGEEPPDGTKDNEELEKIEKVENRKKWDMALQKINKDKIKLVDLDIRLTAGSSLPTNRMAKEQIAIEKFKVGLYDRQAALEYSSDPKAEEISDRMDTKEEKMAQSGMTK